MTVDGLEGRLLHRSGYKVCGFRVWPQLAVTMSGVCIAVPGNKWRGYICGKGISSPIVGLIHSSEPPIRRFRGIREEFYNVKRTSRRNFCNSIEEFQKAAE